MSVKRYTNGADDDQGTILPFMEESPNGDYVEYADYARLKAEVERLRKAGDGLEQAFREGWNMTQAMPEIDAWLDAKEGKPGV